MEVLQDHLHHATEWYTWALSQADQRVASWPLMEGYTPTLVLTGAYLLVIWLGTVYMQHRPAFSLKWPLVFYNAALVVLNFHIFSELFTASWKLGYSYSCQTVNYSDDPDEIRIASALWWYYVSKLVEFLDTVFFVLRKKNNQVSFLHVYHHATMFPIWWIGVKWVAGGQSFFGAMINSFIHVLMYTYYGLAGLGPQVQKYLWWKRYLTRIQLVQFVVGMIHAAQSIYLGCQFPTWMQWALIVYGMTILGLFLNFYFQAYIKPSKAKHLKKDHAANGHVVNGHITQNGKPAETKKSK